MSSNLPNSLSATTHTITTGVAESEARSMVRSVKVEVEAAANGYILTRMALGEYDSVHSIERRVCMSLDDMAEIMKVMLVKDKMDL